MTRAKSGATIGELFRRLRESTGLLQDQVAAIARERGLKWTRATVAAIEIGRRELSLREFLTVRGSEVQKDELAPLFVRALVKRVLAPAIAEQLDAETNVARRLGVEPGAVVDMARRLWGRTLTEERDARVRASIGIGGVVEHVDRMRASGIRPRKPQPGVITMNRMVQARRGHVTRALERELARELKGKKS